MALCGTLSINILKYINREQKALLIVTAYK